MNKKSILFCVLFLFSAFVSCSSDEHIDEVLKQEDSVCVMIVPDIQNYTHLEERFLYLNAIADYYKTNKAKFDAIIQVGDLTNNNKLWQYENAYNYFFSKFGYNDQLVFCLGNHDYGNNGRSDVRSSNFPSHMTPAYDIKMDRKSCDNYVRFLSIGGKKYGVLVLEFATREETLDWANKIVSEYFDVPFLVLTHAFQNKYGQLYDYSDSNCENSDSPKKYKMGPDYHYDSTEIYKKLIYGNPNIKMVICGHSLTPNNINVLTKENIKGEKVHFLMVNYQHFKNGGEGMVGLLFFNDGRYKIKSFSTIEQTFKGGIDITF